MPRILLPLCCLLLLAAGCGQQQPKTLKLAHGMDTGHPVHQGIVFMAERLRTKSAGQLQLEIYPSQQLGTERQCLELLQIGSLAMTKVSAAVMENFSPGIKVLSLPYIFRDRAHTFAVLDGPIGRELLRQGERYRLRGLGYFDAGQRSFYTKTKAIRQPDDLGGLKIRVQESAVAIRLVSILGAAPTPVSWGELYTGLQQGVVDGAENNLPSFYSSRHYEVCKQLSLNEHATVPDILVIGSRAWQQLSAREQRWLQEAADEAIAYQRKLWAEAEAAALKAVEAEGVIITRPDKAAFAARSRPMWEDFRNDTLIYPLITAIQAVQ